MSATWTCTWLLRRPPTCGDRARSSWGKSTITFHGQNCGARSHLWEGLRKLSREGKLKKIVYLLAEYRWCQTCQVKGGYFMASCASLLILCFHSQWDSPVAYCSKAIGEMLHSNPGWCDAWSLLSSAMRGTMKVLSRPQFSWDPFQNSTLMVALLPSLLLDPVHCNWNAVSCTFLNFSNLTVSVFLLSKVFILVWFCLWFFLIQHDIELNVLNVPF